jgi:hypothetical protein
VADSVEENCWGGRGRQSVVASCGVEEEQHATVVLVGTVAGLEDGRWWCLTVRLLGSNSARRRLPSEMALMADNGSRRSSTRWWISGARDRWLGVAQQRAARRRGA